MKLRPLNDTLIVKLDEDEWLTSVQKPELIHIPSAVEGGYKKKARSGQVISWGNKCHYKYREGERVYFPFSDNREGFKINNEDYKFVKEYELHGKDEDAGS
jgi:co-chaperonin GroES (HSP10)